MPIISFIILYLLSQTYATTKRFAARDALYGSNTSSLGYAPARRHCLLPAPTPKIGLSTIYQHV
jgi:hypothetical protein